MIAGRPPRIVPMVMLWLATSSLSASDPTISSEPSALPLPEALALGCIEGMTEYLPVSSTGHLLIFQHWLGREATPQETEAANALAICIQSGAILAVILLYFGRLQQIVRGFGGREPDGLRLFLHLVIAFLPAAVFGLLFQQTIKDHLFNIRSVTLATFTGAVVILTMGRFDGRNSDAPGKDLTDLRWWEALAVGCLQCIAFWPGFSRSLATILGCRAVNLRLTAAVEFSFLLGLITLIAATAKEAVSHGPRIVEHYGALPPLVALAAAFVSAIISVKFMISILSRFGLIPFGYYRLLLAAVCLLLWN